MYVCNICENAISSKRNIDLINEEVLNLPLGNEICYSINIVEIIHVASLCNAGNPIPEVRRSR